MMLHSYQQKHTDYEMLTLQRPCHRRLQGWVALAA